MIIEALMLIYLATHWSGYLLVGMLAVVAIRRWTPFADAAADILELDQYDGLTAWVARYALPAMSSAEEDRQNAAPMPVHVPVPRTDTKAIEPPDRDITRDLWIKAMALARDEKGKYLYSANDIHDANHGHRATVLARVKELRADAPPPQFRQDDETTAPATYPVTQRGA